MKTFYISLARGLMGYYIKVQAPSEAAVRSYAVRYCGRLWCEIYTEAYFYEILRKRFPKQCRVINTATPVVLHDEDGTWE